MSRFLPRLLAALAIVAYAATAVGPHGAMLCVGGGHDGWTEMIARGCEHAGHAQDRNGLDAVEADAHRIVASECQGCHHQDSDHGPCTDIPIDGNDGRPNIGAASAKAATTLFAHEVDLGKPTHALAFEGRYTLGVVHASRVHDARVMARRHVLASLRAVILLV